MNEASRSETDAIRSNIDETRHRMDETMDALGNRLQGRHLVDEVLGFFRRRSDNGDGMGARTGQKIKQSADTAMHAVVDTVKANPLPSLMIGAGIAWMIYESRRGHSTTPMSYDYGESTDYEPDYESDLTLTSTVDYDPEAHLDRPLDYSTGGEQGGTLKEKLGHAGGAIASKASAAGSHVKDALGTVGGKAREKMMAARERAAELGGRARERSREAYLRSRERVAQTADHHPLESGLACLAIGLVAGLLLPTPEKVNRVAGPRMDRLRDRTRDAGREAFEKGRRVAQAATAAVKQEAEAQGLTLNRIKEKAGAVADRAKEAATDSARDEGIAPGRLAGGGSRQQDAGNPSGSSSDPSTARPAV